MFLSLMQTNPGVLPALGPRFALIAQEIERLEKMEDLKVKQLFPMFHTSIFYCMI